MAKRLLRENKFSRRPTDPQVRASASRIVDILQQLVLARPEMIIPLEDIVKGILTNLHIDVETQMWERQDELRSRGRTPPPPAPLSELPEPLALLKPPAIERPVRKRGARAAEKPRRR